MPSDRQGQLLEIGSLLKKLPVKNERKPDIRIAAEHIGRKIGLKGRYKRLWEQTDLMPASPVKALVYLERLRKSAELLREAVEVELPNEVAAKMPDDFDPREIADIAPILKAIEQAVVEAKKQVVQEAKTNPQKGSSGRKPNQFALGIALEAARAFQHLTDRDPSVHSKLRKKSDPSPHATEPGGPYYELVEALFNDFGVGANPAHYAAEAARLCPRLRRDPAKSPKPS